MPRGSRARPRRLRGPTGLGQAKVATALNGWNLSPPARGRSKPARGDRLEVCPRCREAEMRDFYASAADSPLMLGHSANTPRLQ